MLGMARSKMREGTMSVIVTRADGTVEDLGVVAYYHRNPLRRLAWRLRNRKR
jgi:hypothetical protein